MPTLMALAAREVLDSRGRPTVEVEATASTGESGRAIVPSGASTGKHEALELRDGDPRRHAGLGVLKAVANVRGEIAGAVLGLEVEDQAAIDAALIALDGTPNKARLGANALLGVSMAVAHAASASRGRPLFEHLNRLWRARLGPGEPGGPSLPMPMVNMISGGLHAGGNLEFQDFLVVPIGASTYSEALMMAGDVRRSLARVLARYGHEASLVADEGGFGPRLRTNARAVELILEAAQAAGLTPGRDVAIALDVAATHFYDPTSATYRVPSDGAPSQDSSAMLAMLAHWARQYPIVSIEDGLAEDDWNGWAALTRRVGGSVQLVGDDLFATQVRRIEQGVAKHAANAVLIKPNQVGTLTETLDALALARRRGYRAVVSARSGETEDATIADLAVAAAAGQIKIGSLNRSERLAKYNRLLRIEERLGPDAPFSKWPSPAPR